MSKEAIGDIEIPGDDIVLIWQLACAYLPACNYDFTEALRTATLARSRAIIATREANGGLEMQVIDGHRTRLIRDVDGRWFLRQR